MVAFHLHPVTDIRDKVKNYRLIEHLLTSESFLFFSLIFPSCALIPVMLVESCLRVLWTLALGLKFSLTFPSWVAIPFERRWNGELLESGGGLLYPLTGGLF